MKEVKVRRHWLWSFVVYCVVGVFLLLTFDGINWRRGDFFVDVLFMLPCIIMGYVLIWYFGYKKREKGALGFLLTIASIQVIYFSELVYVKINNLKYPQVADPFLLYVILFSLCCFLNVSYWSYCLLRVYRKSEAIEESSDLRKATVKWKVSYLLVYLSYVVIYYLRSDLKYSNINHIGCDPYPMVLVLIAFNPFTFGSICLFWHLSVPVLVRSARQYWWLGIDMIGTALFTFLLSAGVVISFIQKSFYQRTYEDIILAIIAWLFFALTRVYYIFRSYRMLWESGRSNREKLYRA